MLCHIDTSYRRELLAGNPHDNGQNNAKPHSSPIALNAPAPENVVMIIRHFAKRAPPTMAKVYIQYDHTSTRQ